MVKDADVVVIGSGGFRDGAAPALLDRGHPPLDLDVLHRLMEVCASSCPSSRRHIHRQFGETWRLVHRHADFPPPDPRRDMRSRPPARPAAGLTGPAGIQYVLRSFHPA